MGWVLRGIRGATTVAENSIPAVEMAVVELLAALQERNQFDPADICSAFFSMTPDLDAIFPSQIVRKSLPGWEYVPFMDVAHLQIEGSLPQCIRVLLQVNAVAAQQEIRHVYLHAARCLRPDLI